MYSYNVSENLIWLDCEVSGLCCSSLDTLLKIAVVVTDKQLNILGTIYLTNIEIPQDDNAQKVRDSKISMKEAENQIMQFLNQWTTEGNFHVAGNSVGQDVKFIEKHMPEFNYRSRIQSSSKIIGLLMSAL